MAFNSPPILMLQYSEYFLNKNLYYVEKVLFSYVKYVNI